MTELFAVSLFTDIFVTILLAAFALFSYALALGGFLTWVDDEELSGLAIFLIALPVGALLTAMAVTFG